MSGKPMTANHYIGFAFGWLLTALIFSQLGINRGRALEKREHSLSLNDSLYTLDSAAQYWHIKCLILEGGLSDWKIFYEPKPEVKK